MKHWLRAAALTCLAVLSQVAGLSHGGAREAVLGWLVPMVCAGVAGAMLAYWPAMSVGVAVGLVGPWLDSKIGQDPPEGTINLFQVPVLSVPIFLGCVLVGLLMRLAWDAWTERS